MYRKKNNLFRTSVFSIVTMIGCFAYTHTVDAKQSPEITLAGSSTVVIAAGESYQDPGASALDPEDGQLPIISTADEFDSQNPGIYVVSYVALDTDGNAEYAHRTVVVETLRQHYGAPTAIKKLNKKKVRVFYAGGESKVFTMQLKKNERIHIAKNKRSLVCTTKKKKKMYRINPYTGEKISSAKKQKKESSTYSVPMH